MYTYSLATSLYKAYRTDMKVRSVLGKFQILTASLLALWLSACANIQPSSHATSPQKVSKQHQELSTLYIYRPHNDMRRFNWPKVFINNKIIVELKDATFTRLIIKPGHYSIRTESGLTQAPWGNTAGHIDIKEHGNYFLLLDQSYNRNPSTDGKSTSLAINSIRWALVPKYIARPALTGCSYIAPELEFLTQNEYQ